MNKKEILGLCEFLKLNGYENTDNISKSIFELQQENKTLKENAENNDKVIDKTINDDRFINYTNTNERYAEFFFDKQEKNVVKTFLNSGVAERITLKELQAINQQISELGWK